jgi:hypothetical protein
LTLTHPRLYCLIMNAIDINCSRSYVSLENLEKATSKLEAELKTIMERNRVSESNIRKIVCRNAEGRWTATYILNKNVFFLAIVIAGRGFMTIG